MSDTTQEPATSPTIMGVVSSVSPSTASTGLPAPPFFFAATTGGGSTGHTRHSAQWKRGGGQKLDASGGVSNLWWGVDPVSAPRGWLACRPR